MSRLKKTVKLIFAFLVFSQPFRATVIPPYYIDCVVALGRKDMSPGPNQGQWIPEASGFLYGKFLAKTDEQHADYRVYLVTNRHVVEEHVAATGGGSLWVRFNLSSPGSAKEYEIPFVNQRGGLKWHFHPNSSVDIAVIPINSDFLKNEGARFNDFRSESDTLSRAKAKDLGLSEGDSVFVLGFPMGLVGQHEDYVVVRQGVIARIKDALDSPVPTSFLIDSFIFPGNSGGPVVLRPELISVSGTKAVGNAYLLGIVKGYIPYTDIAISPQTKHVRVTFEENSGLAEVIPADYIDETIADCERAGCLASN
jgi:S1-C subfamily serine protease